MPEWLTWTAIRGLLGKVSLRTWLEIGAALLLIVLAWHHLSKVYQDGYAAGVAREQSLEKKAQVQQTKKAAVTTNKIDTGTKQIEVKYVQTVRTIHDHADALRLRGPSEVNVNMSAAQPSITGADAAGQPTVGAGLASVQIAWPELVDHAEVCDVYRAQVMGLQDYVTLVQKWYGDFQQANSPTPDGK